MTTHMTTYYQIRSVKHTETVESTLTGAIARAVAIDAEYQPAFGVQVEDTDGNTVYDTEVTSPRDYEPTDAEMGYEGDGVFADNH